MKAKKEQNKKPRKEAKGKAVSKENLSSELSLPRWSVVTFETCAASNLTYNEAAKKLAELQSQKISGLCIITDEAAKKLNLQK